MRRFSFGMKINEKIKRRMPEFCVERICHKSQSWSCYISNFTPKHIYFSVLLFTVKRGLLKMR